MKLPICFALFCVVAIPALAQQPSPPTTAPELPKEPHALFDAAAPYYNFADPSLKPWHLKFTYQLYDEDGKPTEQRTYEYWWASPKVYRSSWDRPSATDTEWHTADGARVELRTGEPLKSFEYKLRSALLSPLPVGNELQELTAHPEVEERGLFAGGGKSTCIMALPAMPPQTGQVQKVPIGLFPTYCFDPKIPAVRLESSLGNMTMEFDNIVQVQGRFLAGKIDFLKGKKPLLTATVVGATAISPTDPALTPAKEATAPKLNRVNISAGVAVGMLETKVQPVYPPEDKAAHISGRVVLQAVIGRDGAIHDLLVIETPSPYLAESALIAVSQWKYRPYLLNDEPVEVMTTINVIFTLGN